MSLQATNGSHDRLGLGIVKMPAIPRQQIVNTVHGGDGKVKRITLGSGRQRSTLEKRAGQRDNRLRDRQ